MFHSWHEKLAIWKSEKVRSWTFLFSLWNRISDLISFPAFYESCEVEWCVLTCRKGIDLEKWHPKSCSKLEINGLQYVTHCICQELTLMEFQIVSNFLHFFWLWSFQWKRRALILKTLLNEGILSTRANAEALLHLLRSDISLSEGHLNSILVGSNCLSFTAWKQEERNRHRKTYLLWIQEVSWL